MLKSFSPALLMLYATVFLNLHPVTTHANPLDTAVTQIKTLQTLAATGTPTDPLDPYFTQIIQLLNSIVNLYNTTLTDVSTYGPEVTEFISATESTAQIHGPKVLEFMDAFIGLYKMAEKSAPTLLPKTIQFMDAFISMKDTLSYEIGPATNSLNTAATGLHSIGSLADTISAHPYLFAAGVAATLAAGCLLKDFAKSYIFTLDPARSLPVKAWHGCCWVGSRLKSLNPWSYFTASPPTEARGGGVAGREPAERTTESTVVFELPRPTLGSQAPLLEGHTSEICDAV